MDNNKNKESFLKGALILGAAGVVVKIMGAFFRIPLGNLIGSTGMGYYQAVYPVYTLFLTLATAGFPTALAKLVSEKRAIGDFGGAAKTFKVASTVLFLTGLVSFCIFYFGADFIVNGIMKNEGALASMKAIAPALLFVPLMSSFRGYFQGRREMSKIAISQMVEQFFRVVLGIAIAYYWMVSFGPEQGAAGGVLGAAIGGFASIVFLVLAYLKGSKKRKMEIESSKNFKVESTKTVLKRILYVAIPITIGACVMPLVNMVDSVVVVRRLQESGFDVDTANSLLGQLTGMAMATEPSLYKTKNTKRYTFGFVGDPQIGASYRNMNGETELEKQDKAVRNDSFNWNNTIKNMIRRNCDLSFIISAGDQIQSGYKKNESYDHNEIEYAGYLSPCVLKSIPIATTIGNHDENSENYSYHFNLPNKSKLGSTVAGSTTSAPIAVFVI